MKDFLKNSWKYILPLIIGVIMGVMINIPSCQKQPEPKIEYIEKHDTVTVEKERIVEKTKIKYIDRIDTFYVKESGDTVLVPDLPIEHKVYEDTIKNDSTSTEIKIEYSGFNAKVDGVYVHHNYFEKQTTIVKEPKKVGIVWFVGAYAGYGVHGSINTGTFGHGPEIGIGIGLGLGNRIK